MRPIKEARCTGLVRAWDWHRVREIDGDAVGEAVGIGVGSAGEIGMRRGRCTDRGDVVAVSVTASPTIELRIGVIGWTRRREARLPRAHARPTWLRRGREVGDKMFGLYPGRRCCEPLSL